MPASLPISRTARENPAGHLSHVDPRFRGGDPSFGCMRGRRTASTSGYGPSFPTQEETQIPMKEGDVRGYPETILPDT